MKITRKLLVLVFILVLPAAIRAESAFQIVVKEGGIEKTIVVGTLVADELLLTSYKSLNRDIFVEEYAEYSVKDPATGAQYKAELKAKELDSDLALLSVSGLSGEPVTISMEASEVGRRVYVLVSVGSRHDGILHSVIELEDGNTRYRITSIIGENEGGAPLMNNCNELLGISQTHPSDSSGVDVSLGISGTLDRVVAFLQEQGVTPQVSSEVCPSIEDQLSQAKELADELRTETDTLEEKGQRQQEEKAALEQKLEEITQSESENRQADQEQLQELEAQRAALVKRLRKQEAELSRRQGEIEEQLRQQQDLEEQIEGKERERQLKEEELARHDREREQLGRLHWAIGIGLAILLLVVVAVVRRQLHTRKRQLSESTQELAVARSNLERSDATFPDVVLVSVGPVQREFRIKVNGISLARSETGHVIGRSSANADCVIGVESVSRKHARLRVDGQSMTIEDIGSLNGTSLNGVRLKPGESRVVRDGARITLGDVNLVVQFLQHRSQ